MNLTNKKFFLFPLALVIYEIAVYLSNDMYLPALVPMQADFQTTAELTQATVTAFILGSGTFQVFIGLLSDKIGRRPIMLATGVIFIITTVACAVIKFINPFLIARFIQGGVISGIFVAGYAAIHELLETKQAIVTLAWMNSISVLAPAFGPLLGSAILAITDSWRSTFWLLAIIGFITVSGLYCTMPETLVKSSQQQLSERPKFSNYWQILTNKNFMIYNVIAACYMGNMIAWITTGPLLTANAFHLAENYFGVMQVIIFGCYVLGTKLVSRLARSQAPQQLIASAICITSVAPLLLLIHLIWLPEVYQLLIGALSISAIGSGLGSSSLQRLAMEQSPLGSGAKMAVYTTITGLIISGYSIIVTSCYDATTKPITLLVMVSIGTSIVLARWAHQAAE